MRYLAFRRSPLHRFHQNRHPKGRKRKVFLIVDNLRVHRARAVAAWADGHLDKIEPIEIS